MPALEDFGWTPELARQFAAERTKPSGVPGRVTAQHRGAFGMVSDEWDGLATLSGRMRHEALEEDLPVVGDWVEATLSTRSQAQIHRVLPRRSRLARRDPSLAGRAQVLAANVDTVFVITSANDDFNARRLERLVAMAREGRVEPVIAVSKVDLVSDRWALITDAANAAPGCDVLALSGLTGDGLSALDAYLKPGRTAALVGSSGVGKSTLLNRLVGETVQLTLDIRDDDSKGRHATTRREMFLLPQGGVLIDTPGLREVGILGREGVAAEFSDVGALAEGCRFGNCSHEDEPDCAVLAAVADGIISAERVDSCRKLQREAERHLALGDSRLHAERRRQRRNFSKMVRRVMKQKRGDHIQGDH